VASASSIKSAEAEAEAAAEEAAEAAFADLLHYGPRLQHLVADCLNALISEGIVEEDEDDDEDEDEDDYDDY
jgi:phospholipase/lecithinase/hemolysin